MVLGSGFGIGFSPRTRSPSSRHPPFTHYPFPPRSLVCGGQPSPQAPHKSRLVVSHSTCPPLSSSPHAHSFVIGPAVINTHGRSLLQHASTHQRLCSMVWALGMTVCRSTQAVSPRRRHLCRGTSPSLSGSLRTACLENWSCFCCSIQRTRWPHYRGQRCGRHSGCAHTTASIPRPPVFSQVVFMRERKRTSLQHRYSRVLRWSS